MISGNYYGTRISKNNMGKILNRHMTPSQIIDYLENGATYRSFQDVLQSVYSADDLSGKLVDGLIMQHEKELSKKEQDTIK